MSYVMAKFHEMTVDLTEEERSGEALEAIKELAKLIPPYDAIRGIREILGDLFPSEIESLVE